MKKIFYLLAIMVSFNSNAQDYSINFLGTGSSAIVGKVKVQNLVTGELVEIDGYDILHLKGTVGINDNYEYGNKGIKVYPNPVSDRSIIEILVPFAGDAFIAIYNMAGKQIVMKQDYLDKGRQEFLISGIEDGLYLIDIEGKAYRSSGRLMSVGGSRGPLVFEKISNNILEYANDQEDNLSKGVNATVDMAYNDGERLKFTGISGSYRTVITDVPSSDKTLTFNFMPCTDGDNNNYPVVQIGTQIWMEENLKSTKNSDGSAITKVEGKDAWAELTTPAYCWYGNDAGNGALYGALYNWYAIDPASNGGKNVCPAGWHVPGDEEWKQLEIYLGMSPADADKLEWRGTSEGGELKETGYGHWNSPNTGADNSSGFTALPGGYRWADGYFLNIGNYGLFWSGSSYNGSYALKRTINYQHSESYRYYNPKTGGFSVRCLKTN